MKRIFLASMMLVIASFITGCDPAANTGNKPANAPANNAATTAPATANHEADVKKLLGDFAAALSKNDAAAIDKIYADDYTLVTNTGEITTKAQRLEAIKSGDLKFESVTFDEVKVRSYGDSAIAIARSSGKSTLKGKAQTNNYRITFVATKTKDGWRLVSAQLTDLEAGAAPAKADDKAKVDNNASGEAPANAPANK